MGKVIEFKYDVGDTVKYKIREFYPIYKTCGFCGGKGKIKGLDETWEDCPVCEGQGSNHEGSNIVEVIKEGTISAIHIHYDSNAYPTSDKPYYTILREIGDTKQEDIIEKIVTEEEKLRYTD